MLPLEGLTVIAVEQAVAAPFCSSRLADAGAHVIKVERPEGDFARGYDAAAKGQSSYFVWLNRGKDSVVIDLATSEGRAELEAADRRRRRLDPEPQARFDGQARLHAGTPAQGLPEADLLHHLRLRRRRPLRTPQGLRSPDPGRKRTCLDHRRPGRPVARRRLHCRYRDRRHRACGDPRGVDRALARRRRRRHPDFDVRRDGRLAVGAAAQRRSRQPAATDGPCPSLDRALWRVSIEGRQGHPDLDPERARVEEALRGCAGPARPAQRSPVLQHGRARAQSRAHRQYRRRIFATDDARRAVEASRPMPTSPLPKSTPWPSSQCIRICAASRSKPQRRR